MARLVAMLAWHAERIEANHHYARSQRNNHGISEGVGLYTVGLLFPELADAFRWREVGRRILEEEGLRQIAEDGGYAQHSLNYHRLLLHDYLWVMRLAELNGQTFSPSLYDRIDRASELLFQLIDPSTGHVPNYGANDGALILPLANCDYMDFRPTLQASHYLGTRSRLFPPGPWDEMLFWLFGPEALSAPLTEQTLQPVSAAASGYYTLRGENTWAFLRCAEYRNRPSHADQLHADIWWRGVNVACDAGTYSYGEGHPWRNALSGARVHNTVTVDGRDQMIRAGRFLWLAWTQGRVRAVSKSPEAEYLEGEHDGYRAVGVIHRRAVLRVAEWWIVVDDLLGEGSHEARLHWLLVDAPYEFRKELGHVMLSLGPGQYGVQVWSSLSGGISLVRGGTEEDKTRGWRSRYYAEKEPALSLVLNAGGPLPIRFISTFRPDLPSTVGLSSGCLSATDGAACIHAEFNPPGKDLILREARLDRLGRSCRLSV
jgi:asparagine synthase (glutamine-hydrolysing)